MTEHITNQEWIEYLSCTEFTPAQLELFARVHAHIGSCADCRALHAASIQSKEALRVFAPAAAAAVPSAYRAVAAQPVADEEDEDTGSAIAVPFEITADGARFKANQMILSGEAERYVFVANDSATRMTDDFDDATRLELTSDALVIALPDTGCELSATISNAEGTTDLPGFDADGNLSVPLPAEGRYVLNIVLGN